MPRQGGPARAGRAPRGPRPEACPRADEAAKPPSRPRTRARAAEIAKPTTAATASAREPAPGPACRAAVAERCGHVLLLAPVRRGHAGISAPSTGPSATGRTIMKKRARWTRCRRPHGALPQTGGSRPRPGARRRRPGGGRESGGIAPPTVFAHQRSTAPAGAAAPSTRQRVGLRAQQRRIREDQEGERSAAQGRRSPPRPPTAGRPPRGPGAVDRRQEERSRGAPPRQGKRNGPNTTNPRMAMAKRQAKSGSAPGSSRFSTSHGDGDYSRARFSFPLTVIFLTRRVGDADEPRNSSRSPTRPRPAESVQSRRSSPRGRDGRAGPSDPLPRPRPASSPGTRSTPKPMRSVRKGRARRRPRSPREA